MEQHMKQFSDAHMEQFSDVQMEQNSEYLDLRSEAKMRIPFGTQNLTYPRSSVSGISFGIQGKSITNDRGHLGRGVHYNGTPVQYNDYAHPRSRRSGIPFGISFGILEIIDNFINFLHECCAFRHVFRHACGYVCRHARTGFPAQLVRPRRRQGVVRGRDGRRTRGADV